VASNWRGATERLVPVPVGSAPPPGARRVADKPLAGRDWYVVTEIAPPAPPDLTIEGRLGSGRTKDPAQVSELLRVLGGARPAEPDMSPSEALADRRYSDAQREAQITATAKSAFRDLPDGWLDKDPLFRDRLIRQLAKQFRRPAAEIAGMVSQAAQDVKVERTSPVGAPSGGGKPDLIQDALDRAGGGGRGVAPDRASELRAAGAKPGEIRALQATPPGELEQPRTAEQVLDEIMADPRFAKATPEQLAAEVRRRLGG
jgi:hypothetical protein